MKWKWIWIVRWGLLAMLLCASLCWSAASVKRVVGGRSPVPGQRQKLTREKLDAFLRGPAFNSYMADLSLAVREQDDFLLTPALLVQEAVSDGVVLTYPEE